MNVTMTPQAGSKHATTAAADKTNETKLRKACSDFEAIVLRQMLTSMRESIPKSGLLDGGYAEKMYQSMRDEELAKEMAGGKGTGLGELLFKQLSGQSRLTVGKRGTP